MVAICFFLMIIDDFDILRTRRLVRPLETDSPLIINANAVLPFSIASKCFETITRQCRKIPEHACCLQTVQLQTRGTFDTRKCFYALGCGEMFSPLVVITNDHIDDSGRYVLRQA